MPPDECEISVHVARAAVKIMRASDILSAEPILPGFTLPLAKIFE